MSKYKNCLLFVDANGRYCCTDKRIKVGDGKCASISLINIEALELIHYPSGDTDEPYEVVQVLPDGRTIITDPGIYRILIDCEEWDGIEAPENPQEQAMVCCTSYTKTTEGTIVDLLQALCEKLVLGNDATALAEIISQLEAICEKLLSNGSTQSDVLVEIQSLCDKILEGNNQTSQLVVELMGLCEKLNQTNESLATLIDVVTTGFTDMLACLEQMKEGQASLEEKLCDILGDPNGPCPECDPPTVTALCDVSWFMTYAQPTFAIESLVIPGVETNSKFTFPINGNSLPELQNFQETVVACLEANGYPVTVTTGRDGWQLDFNGPCPVVTTSGQGSIDPACTNCVSVDSGNDFTGKIVNYTNADDTTDLAVSVGGDGDIKIDETDTSGEQNEIVGCITDCLAAGHNVAVEWTTSDGGSGTATLLADQATNPFPSFYNDSTDATGDSGKIETLTITCQ